MAAPARDLLVAPEVLLPGLQLRLINPLVYSNARALGDAAYCRWLQWCNVAREVPQNPVLLGQYEPGCFLDTAGPYAVLAGGVLVEEQAPGDAFDQADVLRRLRPLLGAALAVDRPCLLACRHGEWTWGHWLLDMLPKIVLAEQFAPKRFTYVVPAGITNAGDGRFYVRSVLQSLAAYGIDASRLLRVRADAVYRFAALFDVADMVDDGVHPGVLAAMRQVQGVPAAARRGLSAVLRRGAALRPIANMPDIERLLAARGAVFMDPGATDFAGQVAAFRDSDVVAGDLGSNLAAAIYAPPGSGFVTLGPLGWHDDYFVNIMQRLGAFQADVRGVAMPRGEEGVGHAPHVVNPAAVEAGLAAVAAARGAPACVPVVAGRRIARAPGKAVWEIWFGARGNAGPFQRGDFAPPEARGTWSMGTLCRIEVPGFVAPCGDMWLEVQGIGFIAPPHMVSRVLAVAVNGTLLAEFDIDLLTHVHVPVPGALLSAAGGLRIEFRHTICPSPLVMGVSADARALGFMFERLALLRA